ncbi:exosortase H-associated membrane protein [Marinicella sediminis]|uniref:Exosortase H-associated membrane protein n=1 Tax=Marinicella sediminis TaxID=1792834 RepID=A0ABV7J8Y7_9GAMM|nr:exosortase H-associated membrane protein [Marinicella sediminis]
MKSPIRELLVSSVLYLPLCFFLWFYSATLLVLPVKWLAEFLLLLWQPDLFNGITQSSFLFQVETLIFPKDQMGAVGTQVAVLDVSVNPMKYGYGLAVFAGLVLSLPNASTRNRILQILVGYVLVVLVQTSGVFWETCKSLLFSGSEAAFTAINDTGISHNLVAVMYQMSYLILPAIVPVVAWVLLNRRFVEQITNYNAFINQHKR